MTPIYIPVKKLETYLQPDIVNLETKILKSVYFETNKEST